MGSMGSFALKLDMSKAYNRVKWLFLRLMLARLGFSSYWVQLVMKCVESVSYSVVINGEVGERFIPARGLQQGDPISPYLFLIYSEGLSALLRRIVDERRIRGV